MDTTDNKKPSIRKRIPRNNLEKVTTSFGSNLTPIDLGLPSGTKWAPCNVGAFSSEEVGDFFAFGETETKNVFSRDNYSFNIKEYLLHFREKRKAQEEISSDTDEFLLYIRGKRTSQEEIYHIGSTSNDVATIKYGTWKIPSADQFKELLKYCSFEYDRLGAWGTSKRNGNKIYFPAYGYRIEDYEEEIYCFDGLIDDYDYLPHGYYWTDTMVIGKDPFAFSEDISAHFFFFNHEGCYVDDDHRNNIIIPQIRKSQDMQHGFLIRPVLL